MRKPTYLHSGATHRRTQSDYVATLLEAVPLDTWREVVEAAVLAAKNGDAQARAWLASYLMGKADAKAPAPVNVVVAQLTGRDVLVRTLTEHLTGWQCGEGEKEAIREAVAQELERIDK